jgi:hypothetical protein
VRLIQRLEPQLLIHGHTRLTEAFTIAAFPALQAALRELYDVVVEAIRAGATLGRILHRNHLPGVLHDNPAVLPYLVMRENVIKRVHRQRTGYWQPDGEGIEHITPAEWAATLDVLTGGKEQAFVDAIGELNRRGDDVLALRLADLALLRHASSEVLPRLRQQTLYRLLERHQYLDPFKFVVYSELAAADLPPMVG